MQAPPQVGEHVQRGEVRPLQVIEHQQQGLALSDSPQGSRRPTAR